MTWEPLTVAVIGFSGLVAGPGLTEPSLVLNSLPWQGQLGLDVRAPPYVVILERERE